MNDMEWKVDGGIQCQQMTAEYLDETINLLETAFFPHENFCRSLDVAGDPQALLELGDLAKTVAKKGVSVVAVDKKVDQVVGAFINNLQGRVDPVLDNLVKTWKSDKSIGSVNFMNNFYNEFNLFDHCQVDFVFEQMFLVTSPEYRRRGIGRKLSDLTLEIAENLANGINVRKSIDGTELDLEQRPQLIRSISTSFITQKIGKLQGYEFPFEKRYDDIDYCGMDFTDVVKCGTMKMMMKYKRLGNKDTELL